MQIHITADDARAQGLLDQIQRRGHALQPVLSEIGEIARTGIERTFAAGGRPHTWSPSARVRREGGQTLSDTGRLRRSFSVQTGAHQVAVGTNVSYAAPLHFGAKIGPHVIRPRAGRALFWPGAAHPVKQVRHPGCTIPARPFLLVAAEDWPKIHRALLRHVTGG